MPKLARLAAAALLSLAALPALADEDYQAWEPLQRSFPSTGGGGWMIGEYDPVIVGNRCTTDFTATSPEGTIFYNTVEFDAVPVQGGTLCTNGRWRARDGSAAGSTPFRVFFGDGTRRRSP